MFFFKIRTHTWFIVFSLLASGMTTPWFFAPFTKKTKNVHFTEECSLYLQSMVNHKSLKYYCLLMILWPQGYYFFIV